MTTTGIFTDGYQTRDETNHIVTAATGTPDLEPRSKFELLQLEAAAYKVGAGFHFAIDVTGEVYMGRRVDAVAHFEDQFDWDSVVVLWVGSTELSPKQERALFALLQRLRQRYPRADLIKHR